MFDTDTELLPARPFKLKAAYLVKTWCAAVWATLMVVIAAPFFVISGWQESRDLLETRTRWDRGVDTDGKVSGRITTAAFLVRHYELDVVYSDLEGTGRRGRCQFMALLDGPELDSPVSVRFDPVQPQRPVLSWEWEWEGRRWSGVVFLWLGGVGGCFALAGGAWVATRRARATVAVAAASREVHCDVLDSVERQRLDFHEVKMTIQVPDDPALPPEARGLTRRVTFSASKRKVRPLYADLAESKLVVLLSDTHPKFPIAISRDFEQFTLTAAQRRVFIANLVRRRASTSA